ncbi:MAG: HAD hydrolase family protein, partial [Polyangiaceae bacterium]|nr:HAD hydrolase family protein [Polyangiaceae bacterium]
MPMKSLSAIDISELKGVEGLLFDLDDTFVDHQGILAEAYEALWALQRSGYRLIALTGRPASWCEPLPRLWPIEGAIAENGAVAYLKRQRRVVFHDSISSEERKARRRKLDQLSAAIQLAVPELMPADDVQGR